MNETRDPIERWLNVFVRLLRVPRADAQRIRDELEDHLRARVDDLMVTGHDEPEAVRIAVAELGETAQLARDFAAAHTSPRRRLLMQTTVLAAAGIAIVTGSTALLSVSSIPSTSQQAIAQTDAEPPAGAMAVGVAEAEPLTFKRGLVATDGEVAVFADLVELLEETTGQRVIVPFAGISETIGRIDVHSAIRPVDLTGLTVEQGLEFIGIDLGTRPSDPFVLNKTDTALELAPQSYFDRRDAVLIEYDISDLLYPPAGQFIEPTHFADTVVSLVEPGVWMGNPQTDGPRARMGVLSTTMIVHAHPRIHTQIMDLFARIEARYKEQRDVQRAERRNELETQLVQYASEIEGYETRISEIQSELGRVRSESRAARERLFEIDVRSDEADGDQLVKLKVQQADAQDVLSVTESQLHDLERRLSNMKQSLAVSKGQLRSAEAQLVKLDEPTG